MCIFKSAEPGFRIGVRAKDMFDSRDGLPT